MNRGQLPVQAAMAKPVWPGRPRSGGSAAGGPAPPGVPANPPTPPKPKAKIPLDELESIRFERTPAMSARFMGQPNVDFTMPGLSAKKEEPPKKEEAAKKDEPAKKAEVAKTDAAMKKGEAAKKAAVAAKTPPVAKSQKRRLPRRLRWWQRRTRPKKAPADDVLAPPPGTTITKIAKVEPKKNGIRDMNISLFGLRDKAIKQVMINCQTATGPVGWRLDTSDSQDWPVVIERSRGRAHGRHLPRATARRLLREGLHDQHQL